MPQPQFCTSFSPDLAECPTVLLVARQTKYLLLGVHSQCCNQLLTTSPISSTLLCCDCWWHWELKTRITSANHLSGSECLLKDAHQLGILHKCWWQLTREKKEDKQVAQQSLTAEASWRTQFAVRWIVCTLPHCTIKTEQKPALMQHIVAQWD